MIMTMSLIGGCAGRVEKILCDFKMETFPCLETLHIFDLGQVGLRGNLAVLTAVFQPFLPCGLSLQGRVC